MTIKAVILAGGFGTRLSSVSGDKPKPMVPIMGTPFLEFQTRFLKEFGIKDIILCVYHKSEAIKSHFGTGLRFGINLTYSEEDIPLGTAGAVKHAEKYIDDTFLVMNADSYCPINLAEMIALHQQKKGLCTMALANSQDPTHYGNVLLDSQGRIIDFIEKQVQSSSENKKISAGIYIFDKSVLARIEKDRPVSLEKDIFPSLAKEGKMYGHVHEGYFVDIGRPESYSQFKQDVLNALFFDENKNVKEAMKKISKNSIDLLLVVNNDKKLLGVLNDRIIKEFLMNGGHIETSIRHVMIKDPLTLSDQETLSNVNKFLIESGIRYLPILDSDKRVVNVEVRSEKIRDESFPILRGRSPLRVSFAGGGTDLPRFFEKYGGAVINATIDKYCHAMIIKRADRRIFINSDLIEEEIKVNALHDLRYDGRLDVIKATIKLMNPDFGFELYLHNDVPPGRGLGSSASINVLIAKMLDYLMHTHYDDYKLAEIAYKAELEELKIKGGWQDQYAAVSGGFNFLEFENGKNIIYPLRLKEEVINELNTQMMLCYVGSPHSSAEMHESQGKELIEREQIVIESLKEMKKMAMDVKDALLTNNLPAIGSLLDASWKIKKKLSPLISNPKIDLLYRAALDHGAYGGRLLGSGGGGYLLLNFAPKKRNMLVRALREAGGEPTNFNFEFKGAQVWLARGRV